MLGSTVGILAAVGAWAAGVHSYGCRVSPWVVKVSDGSWTRGMQVQSWRGQLQVNQQCRPETGDQARSGPTTNFEVIVHQKVLLWLQGLPMGMYMAVQAGDRSWAEVLKVHSWRG